MKRILLLVLFSLLLTSPLWAVGALVGKNCVISWDASTATDITGYHVFVGTAPGSYGPPFTVLHPTTSITCAAAGANADAQFYVTATAYDKVNNESVKAVEVPFTQDVTPPPVLTGIKVISQ